MKRITVVFVLFLLCVFSLQAQTFTYRSQWGSSGSGSNQLGAPKGMTIDEQGNLYVADFSNNRVQKFDSSGSYLTSITGGGLTYPKFVCLDKGGNIYVADKYNIKKYSSAGAYLKSFGSAAHYGIAVDTAGNLFAVEPVSRTVIKYSPTGAVLTTWGSYGSTDGQFLAPHDIALDDSMNVYVVDALTKSINKFTNDGVFVAKWSVGIQARQPFGIFIDKDNSIFITCSLNANIGKYSNTGKHLITWAGPGTGDGEFYYPADVVINSNGDAYATDYGYDRIQFFSYCPNPPGRPSGITGTANHCPSVLNQKYSCSPVSGATGYNWVVPTGWSIQSGQNTTSIVVNVGTAGQNGYVSVAASDSCGTGTPDSLQVASTPLPNIVMLDKKLCPNNSSLFDAGAGHSLYTWSGPMANISTSNKQQASSPGTYKVVVTSIYGCSDSATASVIVKSHDCSNTENFPWLWPSHKNWFGATNLFTGVLVDMETGIQQTLGSVSGERVQQYEGCTIASDDQGNLLFYSSGRTLHTGVGSAVQTTYSGLLAGNEGGGMTRTSAVQGVMTVRHPLAPEKYFIFTTDDAISATAGLNYFTFDKLGNNVAPVGANRLGTYRTSEGIAATRHKNGVDIWITALGAESESFYSYKLTCEGLDTVPVVSNIAPTYAARDQERGGLAFSYDGNYFACTGGYYGEGVRVTLYNFDNSTGGISNRRDIGSTSHSPYDLIFSPDGSKLYVSELGKLAHYDLSDLSLSDSDIRDTRTETGINAYQVALEYAADGYLYIAAGSGREIIRIDGDYNLGTNLTSTPLTGFVGAHGLPTMYLPPAESPQFTSDSSVCVDSGMVDLSVVWSHSKVAAEDYAGNYEYQGAGIVDSSKGTFDPAVAGEGTTRIYFKPAGNCSFPTDSIDLVIIKCITSTNSIATDHFASLSPNPAQQVIKLYTNGLNYQATIYSVEGKKMGGYKVTSKVKSIYVGDLKKGLYFVHLQNEGKIQVLKFIKN